MALKTVPHCEPEKRGSGLVVVVGGRRGVKHDLTALPPPLPNYFLPTSTQQALSQYTFTRKWAEAGYAIVAGISNGSYAGYADPHLSNWAQRYYSAPVYQQLSRLKVGEEGRRGGGGGTRRPPPGRPTLEACTLVAKAMTSVPTCKLAALHR